MCRSAGSGAPVSVFKSSTTPDDPVRGILDVFDVAADELGMTSAELLGRGDILIHGTTRGLNAVLTGATAKTAFVTTRGHRAPIVGRVSMDLITVDITDLGAHAPARGDFVDLIGPDLTLEQVGSHANTIGYEVLTRLPQRFQRVYLHGTTDE